MTDPGRDRLHELLDAVLADSGSGRLEHMASASYSSPFHFARQVSGAAGEPPVSLRRRVALERAAWRLRDGMSVTAAAFEAGYESVDGFARAFGRGFGCPPSRFAADSERSHWLPAPNGIHFHSPTALYVVGGERRASAAGDVVALLVHHDVDDVTALLEAAAGLSDDEYRRVRLPGHRPLSWAGVCVSAADVLRHLVLDKLPWLASIVGDAEPDLSGPDDPASLAVRHAEIGPRWLDLIRDIDRRGAWGDRVVDALCDPPESFLLSQIVAHVLTFSAHLRQLARWMLSDAGIDAITGDLDPDPINWHRRRTGGTP